MTWYNVLQRVKTLHRTLLWSAYPRNLPLIWHKQSLMKILFQNKNQNSKVYELQRKTVTLWSENNTPTFHPNFFYMNDVHYKIFNMENLTATQLMWSSVRSWVSYNHWILWRLNSFWILRVPIFPTTSKHNIHDVSMHIYIHCNLYPWKHSNLYPWN